MTITIIEVTQWARSLMIWAAGIVTFLCVVNCYSEPVYPTASRSLGGRVDSDISDEEMVAAINKKMAYDGVDAEQVNVFVTDGIVTLDGTVQSLNDKQHVQRIATGIRGTRGVVNQLLVTSSMWSDAEIGAAIKRQLATNSATDSYELEVRVKNGEARLTGQVQSLAEEVLSRKIASSVKGVRSLRSAIDVVYPSQRSDQEILEDVRGRIKSDIWIDEQRLSVSVDQGNVIFEGTVASLAQKARLFPLALTAGVNTIDDRKVGVDPALEIATKRAEFPRLDFEIRDSLLESLRLDPRVDASNLRLMVKQGVAVIEGQVGDAQSRSAAIATANNVAGVTKVVDKVTVKPAEPMPDSKIRDELEAAFERTSTLKFDGIRFAVEAGVVRLSGSVPSQYQRRRAAETAYSLNGVVEVDNRLAIDNPLAGRSDFDIQLAIERGIRWSPYLNILKLKHDVNDGIVTFRGTVSDRPSLELARAIAIDAGARDIRSDEVAIK